MTVEGPHTLAAWYVKAPHTLAGPYVKAGMALACGRGNRLACARGKRLAYTRASWKEWRSLLRSVRPHAHSQMPECQYVICQQNPDQLPRSCPRTCRSPRKSLNPRVRFRGGRCIPFVSHPGVKFRGGRCHSNRAYLL